MFINAISNNVAKMYSGMYRTHMLSVYIIPYPHKVNKIKNKKAKGASFSCSMVYPLLVLNLYGGTKDAS